MKQNLVSPVNWKLTVNKTRAVNTHTVILQSTVASLAVWSKANVISQCNVTPGCISPKVALCQLSQHAPLQPAASLIQMNGKCIFNAMPIYSLCYDMLCVFFPSWHACWMWLWGRDYILDSTFDFKGRNCDIVSTCVLVLDWWQNPCHATCRRSRMYEQRWSQSLSKAANKTIHLGFS